MFWVWVGVRFRVRVRVRFRCQNFYRLLVGSGSNHVRHFIPVLFVKVRVQVRVSKEEDENKEGTSKGQCKEVLSCLVTSCIVLPCLSYLTFPYCCRAFRKTVLVGFRVRVRVGIRIRVRDMVMVMVKCRV